MNSLSEACSYDMGKFVLEGVKEIIGGAGMSSVLTAAGKTELFSENGSGDVKVDVTYEDLSAIQIALESIYGMSGGRGISQRAGRASFKFLVHEYGDELGFDSLDYRLLPTGSRIQTGLTSLANIFSSLSGEDITAEADDEAWYWHIDSSPWCWQRSSSDPLCNFSVGVLQEYVSWTSGGKNFSVVETQCASTGAPHCIIRIDRTPFD